MELGLGVFPAGKLNLFETIEHCAVREALEETGLDIKVMSHLKKRFTEDFFEYEHEHYLTFYVESRYLIGIPMVLEPDKCEEWRWYKWGKFPQPLFLPLQNLIKQRYYPL